MRTIHALPLAATALLLAACGGSADSDGDGAISNEEAAAAMEGAIRPQPGQYRGSFELVEFDIPGAPEAMKQRAQSMMGGASEVARGITFCLTPEDAASNGPRQMLENLAESNCSFSRLDVSGGSISADMQCAADDGTTSSMKMDGEMTATSSTMTMMTEQDIAGMGKVRMTARVTSERIGDCP